MKKIISLLASAVVAITFSLPTTLVSAAEFISIGTGGPTGVYFVVGNSVCRMVHKEAAEGRKSGRKHGIRCAAPSTGGSNYNIGQIKEGELQFGVAQSDWQYHAYNGSSKWEGNQFGDLRAVFSVHPEPFQLIAGKGTGINSWGDLKGKVVNIGNPGSGQRGTMEVLMDKHGTSISDFKQATELTSSEQVGALCDGKVDAIGYTVGVPNGAIGQAIDGCGAHFVNLDSDVEKTLVNDNPFYAFANIPAEVYHLKAGGLPNHYKMDLAIAKIDSARSAGLQITANIYTYTAGATGLNASMPPWVSLNLVICCLYSSS